MYSRGRSFEKYNPMGFDKLTTLSKHHDSEGQDVSPSPLFNVNLDPVSNNPRKVRYSSSPCDGPLTGVVGGPFGMHWREASSPCYLPWFQRVLPPQDAANALADDFWVWKLCLKMFPQVSETLFFNILSFDCPLPKSCHVYCATHPKQ